MIHKNKRMEVKLISGKEFLNWTHLTSSDVVSIVLVFYVAGTTKIVWLHTVPLNLEPKFKIKISMKFTRASTLLKHTY